MALRGTPAPRLYSSTALSAEQRGAVESGMKAPGTNLIRRKQHLTFETSYLYLGVCFTYVSIVCYLINPTFQMLFYIFLYLLYIFVYLFSKLGGECQSWGDHQDYSGVMIPCVFSGESPYYPRSRFTALRGTPALRLYSSLCLALTRGAVESGMKALGTNLTRRKQHLKFEITYVYFGEGGQGCGSMFII